MSTVSKLIKREFKKYADRVYEIADQSLNSVVKPWLRENGYRLASGMGGWAVYDGDDMVVTEFPDDVLNILTCEVEGFDQNLGSLMGDYPKH